MALIREQGTFTDRFGNDVDIATGDNADTLLGTADSYVALNTVTVAPVGITYAIGRTIRVGAAGGIRQNSTGNDADLAGKHMYFINCNIIFDAGAELGPSVASGAARSFTGRVGDGQAATTSINFVGCDAVFNQSDNTLQTVSTDWINSNIRITNQFTFAFILNRNPGSRTENTLIETVATTLQEWNFYGNPETLEDVVLSGLRLRTGSGAGDQTVLAPNLLFGDLEPLNFYSFNSASGFNPGFHHPGFTFIATAADPGELVNRASGQFSGNTFVVNHYGYDPTFYDSGLLTADSTIEGIRVRTSSNANIVARTGTNVAGSIVASAKANDTINEYLTSSQGRLISNRHSLDGGTTFAPGFFDYTSSVVNSTVADAHFGTTIAGQALEDGVAIFPLQVWRAGAGFDTTNNIEARAFTHDIAIDNDIAISDYTVGGFVPIDTQNIVGADLVGVSVKASNVSNGLPSVTWNIGDTPSINDIRDRFRGGWSNYDYDLTGGNHLGPVVLTLAAVGGTNYEAAAGSISAACSGIALDGTTDLFTEDTFASINFNGGSCADHNLTALTNITNLGAINNSRLEGTSIEFPTTTATRTNSTLVFNTLAGRLDLATFSSGMIYGRRSGTDAATIRFDNVANGSTINTNQLLGTDWSVVTPGEIQLIATTTNAFTVTVDQYDVDNLVIETAPGVALTPGNTVTTDFITYVFPEESYDVRPAGTIDEIRARGGYFQIRHAGTDVLGITPITNTTMLTDITVQKGASNTDSWVAYYKPATSWGSDRTAYNFTIDTIGQISDNYQVQPIEIANVLVANSETDPGNNLTANYTQGGTKLFIHIDADGNSLNSAESQAVSLEAANSLAYFNVHVAGQRTTQLFEPGINNGSTWLTATDVQFESGKVNDAQQIVSQVTGGLPGGALLTPDAAGYNEVININEVAASIPSIQEAVAGSIDPVNTTLAEVKGNHAVLLRATQRGAVKSATYSAGELN